MMKLKKDTEVIFSGKPMILHAGVEYKNLPKYVLEQLPKSKPKEPKSKK